MKLTSSRPLLMRPRWISTLRPFPFCLATPIPPFLHRIHRPGSAPSERAQEARQGARPKSRTSCSRTQYAVRTPSDPWWCTTSNINTTAGCAEASTSTAAAITSPRAYPRRYRDAAIRLHANLPAATHTCCTRRQARAGGYGAADVWQRSTRGLRSGRCEV